MSDVDDIRRQMAQIRRDVHYDVSNVVSEVEEAMHWRAVIRNYPYIAMGVALAVGYFVVPGRRRRVERTPESAQPPILEASSIPRLATEHDESPPRPLARKAIGWTAGILWPLIGQTVQAYAAMWLEDQIKQRLHLNLQHLRAEGAAPPSGKSGDSHDGDAVYRIPRRG